MERIDIDALKQKIDIVKVISHYLEVTKKGNNFVALCPFHNDSNPSMSISPSKQIFKCFVCSTHGNAFTFIQKYKKISFPAAVKEACDICGIPCDIKINNNSEINSKNAPIYAVLEDLTKYYEFYLNTTNGKEGKDYIDNRRIPVKIVKKFRLGLSPFDPEVSIKIMREKKNHTIDSLMHAGILSGGSKFKDRFCGRIMFPLTDPYGRVVGFSGRRIKAGDESKYVNSPETIVFHKSDILYNYFESKDDSIDQGRLYIVEGFMDVIALARVGFPAVGLMGTALTENHIRLLKNRKVDIYLSLDADDPGQKATVHCAKMLALAGVNFKIVHILDGGKDPDEVLTDQGPEALKKAMNTVEEPLIHFAKYYADKNQLSTYDQKERFLSDFLPLFKAYSPVVLTNLIADLASIIGLDSAAISGFVTHARFPSEKTPSHENLEIPEDLPYIPDEYGDGNFSATVPVSPIVQNRIYRIGGFNVIEDILIALNSMEKDDFPLKSINFRKDEARLINLVRSSRKACFQVSEGIEMPCHYNAVGVFITAAGSFFTKRPNVERLTGKDLDEFIASLKVIKPEINYDYLAYVLHYYDDDLDNSCNDSEMLSRFLTGYNGKMKTYYEFKSSR